eukprot:Filipodium_phascolosomae@DN2488_c0_g1_i1.p1
MKDEAANENAEDAPPNFEPSGLLALDSNSRNGTLLKHYEPPDAREPAEHWRLYLYKGAQDDESKILHIHRKSSWLFGKDIRVADILTQHPTCSKQHAAIQFRQRATDTNTIPYLIDLDSTNGTYINGKKIEPSRYVELRHTDVVRIGKSTREYVLLSLEQSELGSKVS